MFLFIGIWHACWTLLVLTKNTVVEPGEVGSGISDGSDPGLIVIQKRLSSDKGTSQYRELSLLVAKLNTHKQAPP